MRVRRICAAAFLRETVQDRKMQFRQSYVENHALSGHEKHERMLKYFCAIGIAISNYTRLSSANYLGRLDEN